MKRLNVYIEISGKQILAGSIEGNNQYDAVFQYADEYINGKYPALSISLPVNGRKFTVTETKNFFEGLLPEGFARQSVSAWIHASEDDYLTILQVLGAECLGAIRISSESDMSGSYEALSIEDVKALAKEGVSKSTEIITEAHLSLTGASGKVGLYYDEARDLWYKPIGIAPSTHIVKQSHVRLSNIVINEQICLLAAAKLGIEIPESFIINTGSSNDENILFATKRYDRLINEKSEMINGIKRPARLHQEDFAQALGIAATDKYETGSMSYLKQIFDLLRNNVENPIADQIKLWDIIVYDFLVGNTDNHIKNLSLLYSSDLKRIRLAPAYDIICTTMYSGSSRNMAIGIGGERLIDKINESHFERAASEIGFGKKMAMSRLGNIANGFEKAILDSCEELLDMGYEGSLMIGNQILHSGGYKQFSN